MHIPKTTIIIIAGPIEGPMLRAAIDRALTEHVREHFINVQEEEVDILHDIKTSMPYKSPLKFEDYYIDPIIQQEIYDNKMEINIRARQKQWTGKQFKQKNNRRQNRIAYNHGKHRKK